MKPRRYISAEDKEVARKLALEILDIARQAVLLEDYETDFGRGVAHGLTTAAALVLRSVEQPEEEPSAE